MRLNLYTFLFLLLTTSIFAQSGTWEFINNGSSCEAFGQSGSCCQGRHEASYVQSGDKFYLIGGRENNSNVNIYDPSTDTWTVGANAPHPVHHFQAIDYHGLILVVGAFKDDNYPTEQPADKILIYDPANDEWLDGPTIPENRRRGSAGVVVHDDKIYMVSGIQNGHKSGWVPWLDEYDPSTNKWRILPDAPHSRDHFHAAIVNGKIYAGAGRRSGASGVFDATEGAVDIFDLSTEKWTTNSKDIPTQRAGNTVAVLGNEVIYIGGERNAGDANDETEALNVNTGNWRTLAPLNVGRHGSQAIVNNDNIWIASGSPNRGGGTSQSQERFYLSSRTNPSLSALSSASLIVPSSQTLTNSSNKTITINHNGGNRAILVEDISINNSNFQYDLSKETPFILKPGDSFELEITHNGSSNATSQIDITHTGTNGNSSSISLNTESSSSSFTPDPNKTYYLDVPAFNKRLAATGESEDAYTTSTTTTGADVEWQFVDKGNGYWHIQRTAGGSKPRLRTDKSLLADMQETSSSGIYTYYGFTESTTAGTHYITLPNGPTAYQRLQMHSNGEIRFVTTNSKGTWVSWKITEVNTSNSDKVVHIRKRNALNFAIDGKGGAANGQNTHLWSQNQNNANQQWIEINRDNGYYSYQKMGTNHCLDGGASGANRQEVYLWNCSDNNQNQQWKKEDAGSGFVRLIKRNAAGFAINGGSGGANGQNVTLWSEASSSQNLHWLIEEINTTNIQARRVQTNELNVAPVLGQKTTLDWYFHQKDSRPVDKYILTHSTKEGEIGETIYTISASDLVGIEDYKFLHESPKVGMNYYEIGVHYKDGSIEYPLNGMIGFEEVTSPIHIAPNPATDYLNIDLSAYKRQSIDYSVSTMQGQIVTEGRFHAQHEDEVQLDLSNIHNGMYILYLRPKNQQLIAVKFMIAKDY